MTLTTHKIDVVPSTAHVQVLVAGEVVADSRRALVLTETGCPVRYYLPAADVRAELTRPSETHTLCPFKGTASYVDVIVRGSSEGGTTERDERTIGTVGDTTIIRDAAWTYPTPIPARADIAGYLSFAADGVTVLVGE